MAELRLLASDPIYPLANELWGLYAILNNPQVHANEFDIEDWKVDLLKGILEGNMEALLEGMPLEFAEEINRQNLNCFVRGWIEQADLELDG